jgi:hypothetical protein
MEKSIILNKSEPKETVLRTKPGIGSSPVPARLQALLWSKNIKNLDFKKDRIYIIHQVLAYGSIEDIKFIVETYSKDEIVNVFINYPQKVYTRPVFLFIKNYMFKIKTELRESSYVRNIFKSS